MNAAERYAERIDAVGAQRARISAGRAQQSDRWTGAMARRFRADPHRAFDPTMTLIASFLQPDDVFIDVGGGAGRMALPLALRCREAIVVDPSAGMKQEFDELIAESGISNARYVQASWPADGGISGDVTFASHVTYFVREIRPFIQAMHDAARRRVALLIGSVPPPATQAKLFRLVYGEELVPVPGQEALMPVLWEMGLVPEIRVLPDSFTVWQGPIREREAAVQSALVTFGDLDRPKAQAAVEAHFDELFAATAEGYKPTWRPESKTLVITWEK